MNVVLVYNLKSGSAMPESELRNLFAEHAIVIDSLIEVNKELETHLRPYLKKDSLIAVLGGDGTLSSVASMMVGSKAVLIPLPGGTLNHFTKDLGIAQNLSAAVEHLSKAKIKNVDVGNVNERVFLNNSSIGLYSSSLRDRNRWETVIGKWPAALLSGIRVIVQLRGYEVSIQNETFHTPFVFIGNNEYKLDNIGVPVRSALNKGMLSIFIAKKASRLVLLKAAFLSLFGKAHLVDDFEVRTAKTVTIKARRSHLNVSHDGEVSRIETPLHYEVQQNALRVMY